MQDGVDLGVPLQLEVGTELLGKGGLDSLEDVVEDTEVGRAVGGVLAGAALENTGADKAGVPAVHVTTDDVGGGVVTDHVDVLGEAGLAVELLHPGLHDLVGVGVGSTLGLTVDDTLEVDTSEGLVLGFHGDTEGTLGETGKALVLGGHEEITLGEVDGDAGGDRVLGLGHELAVLGEEEIHNDLEVGLVVTRVGEDHDGIELDLGEVAGLGLSALLIGEGSPGRDGGVPGEEVLGVNDVLEAVVLGNLADLEPFTTEDQNSLVVLSQGLHGSVGLDELVGGDGLLEDLAKLSTASLLGLTTTVGQENVGDADAELVVTVENLEGDLGLLNGVVTVCQHTVNVKGESHVLSLGDLLSGHILDLRGQDIPGDGRTASLLHGRQARETRRARNGERCAEGVTRAATVLHGGSQAQVVHESSGITDGAAGSGDLNGVAGFRGNSQARASTLVPGGESAVGIALAGILGSIDSKVGVVEARHGEGGVIEKKVEGRGWLLLRVTDTGLNGRIEG